MPDEKYKMLAVYVWNVLGLLMHSAISDNSRALTFCASWVMSKLHLLKGQYCNIVSLSMCMWLTESWGPIYKISYDLS